MHEDEYTKRLELSVFGEENLSAIGKLEFEEINQNIEFKLKQFLIFKKKLKLLDQYLDNYFVMQKNGDREAWMMMNGPMPELVANIKNSIHAIFDNDEEAVIKAQLQSLISKKFD